MAANSNKLGSALLALGIGAGSVLAYEMLVPKKSWPAEQRLSKYAPAPIHPPTSDQIKAGSPPAPGESDIRDRASQYYTTNQTGPSAPIPTKIHYDDKDTRKATH